MTHIGIQDLTATHVGPTLFERQTVVCSIVAVTETAKNAEAKGFNRNSCLGVFSDHHFWAFILLKFSPRFSPRTFIRRATISRSFSEMAAALLELSFQ